ncbi:MAG: ABC transporter permease [Oscillospiraceae bacterium]|nr:ABC transporter permease [Oscillospiraceae bacterium]
MMNLLRKELSELMNRQTVLSLIVSFVMIVMIGTMVTSLMSQEVAGGATVHIIDEDNTPLTQSVISLLEEQGCSVETGSDFETMAQTKQWTEAVVFPAGMTAAFENHETAELPVYTELTTTSAVKMSMTAGSAERVIDALKTCLADQYLDEELSFLENPVKSKPYTRANGVTVQVSANAVITSLAMFDQVMPLVLFLLVVLTAQTIITAICSEKLDKTLETLLSAPISRGKIIGAKMLAALLVSLLYAAVYGAGFLCSILFTAANGQTTENIDISGAFSEIVQTRTAIQELGLQMPGAAWAGVIAQLALTLAIALTAAIILGALTEDAKNAQYACMPIVLCTIFPYMLSMVSDIRGMEGAAKWLMLAIPFTHTFIATSCMRFHDYALFWGGMVYQAVFLGGVIWFALRLYSSDILFVHSRKLRGNMKKSV